MKGSIRIVSDGTPNNTHVFTHEGHEIAGITHIEFSVAYDHQATAIIKFTCAEAEIVADWDRSNLKRWADKKTANYRRTS